MNRGWTHRGRLARRAARPAIGEKACMQRLITTGCGAKPRAFSRVRPTTLIN